MTVYNSETLEVVFDVVLKRLFIKCHHNLNSAEFREGHLLALQFAKEHQIKQWQMNYSAIGELSDEDDTWVQTIFFPQLMILLGTNNYIAVILSDKCYYRLFDEVGKYGLKSYNSYIILNTFCDTEAADKWLTKHAIVLNR
jgi:hypothetical protein